MGYGQYEPARHFVEAAAGYLDLGDLNAASDALEQAAAAGAGLAPSQSPALDRESATDQLRGSRKESRMAESRWLVAGGAVGGALIAAFAPKFAERVFERRPAIEYKVQVFATSDSKPLSQAIVALEVTGQPDTAESHDTDAQGVTTFVLDAGHGGSAARLQVSRSGYENKTKPVVIPRGSAPESVWLVPIQQTSSPGQVQVRVFSSGPRPSGLGSGWAAHELCSEPAPPGYTIGAAEFSLKGDRSCGAWSECRESRRTPTMVCYEFRLQGHSEWSPPREAYSEGILKVMFVRGF